MSDDEVVPFVGTPSEPGIDPWVVAGSAVLLAGLGLSLATLNSFPPVYADESHIASAVSSWVAGDGLRPTVLDGSGVYDGTTSWWHPYLGTLHFVLADLIGPTTLTTYRLAAFAVALVALVVFGLSLRSRFGSAAGLSGPAALALCAGFFAASHYVRWDSMAFLWVAIALAVLWRGPPTLVVALIVGVFLGVALDVQLSVAALVPGAAALVAWERSQRWTRLALFAAGCALGVAVYLGVHMLPNPAEAREQFDAVAGPGYRIPAVAALVDHDSRALSDQLVRYRSMIALSAPLGSLIVMAVGCVAAIFSLARVTSSYPVQAVPGILLLGYIPGLALIQGNWGTPMYAWYSLPLALAAMAQAARLVPGPARARARGPAAILLSVALAALAAQLMDLRLASDSVTKRPAVRTALARELRASDTVLGETPYWWIVDQARFRSNSVLWLDQYRHHVDLAGAFDRACPSVVILDNAWLSHYGAGRSPFPNFTPPRSANKQELLTLLRSGFDRKARVSGDDWWVELWRRRAACRAPTRAALTSPGEQ